jgi:hypothetical protein
MYTGDRARRARRPKRAGILAGAAVLAALGAATAAPPQPPVVTNISPAFGSILGGTAVIFTGSNFQPPMSVFFGGSAGTNCTAPFNNAFTCNAPPGPVEGPVTVTVRNHTGNTSVDIPGGYLYVCASCAVSPVSMELEGKTPGGTTEPNGILEPGESNVTFAPTWFNASNAGFASGALTGTLSSLSTDSSYIFSAPTATATYGAIGSGGTGTCTGCYTLSFSFTGPRPSPHVDVTLLETPSIAGGAFPDGADARRWTIHVGDSFTDVPSSDLLYPYVENLFHNQVTFGTGDGTTFSPGTQIPRNQMAAFIARAMAGGDANVLPSGTISPTTNPSVYGTYDCSSGGTSLFADVSPTDTFCRYMHFIAGQNITVGCDPTPDFCPGDTVNRRSMAVFIARALVAPGGDAQVPDANTGTGAFAARSYDCVNGPAPFPDVPTSDANCKQIGYIWSLGIVDGFLDGTYGPDLPTTRAQMAKFIVNAFHLSINEQRLAPPELHLAGNSISVHPGSSFSASATGAFLLPSGEDAPTAGGATLRVFDTGSGSGAANFPGTGGAQIIPLPASGWTLQSTGSGQRFAYAGAGSANDPCTSVTISSAGQVTANCSGGITLETPFSGDAALILDAGSSRFCASWQGTTKKNDGTGLMRSDSPAPSRCPAAQAAPQALQFTAPLFANGLTVYQLFPLAGAKGPNADALKITKVSQPLAKMPIRLNSETAGCLLGEPIPCTRQVGVVSIAPDGKSLVYDLNPGENPQPLPTSEITPEPLGPMCDLGTVDPGNTATGTAANPSLFCVPGDSYMRIGIATGARNEQDPCSDPINYWPFPFQFTISDGVTESTQTMILTMFDHTCVSAPPPPTIVTVIPPPDPLTPPQLVAGPAGSPTLDLNTDLPAISLGTIPTGLPGGSGGSFTVPANCPTIPDALAPTCTGTGTLSMDSSAPLLQSGDGSIIQLNQPLVVSSYGSYRNYFNSVTVSSPRDLCAQYCYLQSYASQLVKVYADCYKENPATLQPEEVDCLTGAPL